MPTTMDIVQLILVVAAAVALVFVVRWRRASHAKFVAEYADREICEHLKPVLELLKSRGHHVARAGQWDPEAPLEIHVTPKFDSRAVAEELRLKAPVHVSERDVLYCEEDWCEIRPV